MSLAEKQITEAKRDDLAGWIIGWDITIPNVTLTAVKQSLTNSGLPETYATKLESTSAFTRASKHFNKDRVIDKISVDATGDTVVYQITSKEIVDRADGEKIMNHAYKCRVLLDTRTNSIICPEDQTLEAEIQGHMDTAFQARTSSDISRIVMKMCKEHADLFPIVARKGVCYWVPEKFTEFITKIDKFLTDLGGEVALFPVPTGTPQGNKSIKMAVAGGMKKLITELNDLTDNWDQKTRDTTISNAIKDWRLIEYKLQSYSTYLGSEQENIAKELKNAKDLLKAKGKALLSARQEKVAI